MKLFFCVIYLILNYFILFLIIFHIIIIRHIRNCIIYQSFIDSGTEVLLTSVAYYGNSVKELYSRVRKQYCTLATQQFFFDSEVKFCWLYLFWKFKGKTSYFFQNYDKFLKIIIFKFYFLNILVFKFRMFFVNSELTYHTYFLVIGKW